MRFRDGENCLEFIRLKQPEIAVWRKESRSLRMGRLSLWVWVFQWVGSSRMVYRQAHLACFTPHTAVWLYRGALWEQRRWWGPQLSVSTAGRSASTPETSRKSKSKDKARWTSDGHLLHHAPWAPNKFSFSCNPKEQRSHSTPVRWAQSNLYLI